jgi:hypothetical protein
MEAEVRIYRIRPGELDTWVNEWHTQVVPLPRRCGFDELEYEADDWDSARRAYYDSPERRLMDPDPARHVFEPSGFRVRRIPLP